MFSDSDVGREDSEFLAGLRNNGGGIEGFLLGKAGGVDFSTLGTSKNAVNSCKTC